MKIFINSDIKKLDQYTINNEPIESIDLMQRAAERLAKKIIDKWTIETPVVIFAGPGNNGGDALAIATILIEKDYNVTTYLFNTQNKLSENCQINKEKLEAIAGDSFYEITQQFESPKLTDKHLVIDGLFGSGLNKPLTGGFAAVVKYINKSESTVVAIDIPSGLMSEENTFNIKEHIICADYTFSIQSPKLAFLFRENEKYIGDWEIIDINLKTEAIETNFAITEINDIKRLIKKRNLFDHKGVYGHGLLIAGYKGMAGASVLAARGALRSGVGLLTVHVPQCNLNILQTSVPEAIVNLDASEECFAVPIRTDDFSAVAIGPGIKDNIETIDAVLEQISEVDTPMVIDADAINILAKNRKEISNVPAHSIFTPHPKELDRLIGKCQDSYERLMKAMLFAKKSNVYVILKGAYSAVITPDNKCYFNSTGNPGMATAGSGDVLTGIILALLCQGYHPEHAAKIGTFVHGLAGDIAKNKYGTTALNASDIIRSLPQAWQIIGE